MNIVIWIITILLIVFVVWLLRKWIKRLIFIIILLWLAFMIYWFISPSWAAKLWYNVRTFPNRVSSWLSEKRFLNYEEYKNTKVVDLWEENIDSADEETKSELKEEDVTEQNEEPTLSDNIDKKEQIVQEEFEQQDKSLSSLMDNIKFVDLDGVISWKMETQESWLWYSRSELLTIISDYIQHNLDDESDIVVTVQYNEKDEVEKIILKKQDKSWQQHYSSFSWDFAIDEYKESISQNDTSLSSVKLEWNRHSKALSQKDIRDAEEIFSILF